MERFEQPNPIRNVNIRREYGTRREVARMKKGVGYEDEIVIGKSGYWYMYAIEDICVALCRDIMDSPASNQDHLHVAWRRPLCRFFAGGAVRNGESSSLACGDRIEL